MADTPTMAAGLAPVVEALRWQTPWHEDAPGWVATLPTVERAIVSTSHATMTSDDRRGMLIVGPRRVGKTVVMQQTVRRLLAEGRNPRSIWWLRLDHPELRLRSLGELLGVVLEQARAVGVGATTRDPIALFLDEVTRAQDWDLWLKTIYDDAWPVQVVATSSATSMLRRFRTESGAGRWREVDLPPWMLHEQESLGPPEAFATDDVHEALCEGSPEFPFVAGVSEPHLYGSLLTSGFPGYVLDLEGRRERAIGDIHARMRDEVVTNAIYKDLLLHVGIRNPEDLERLLLILADQWTGLVSPQKIASSLEITTPTLSTYLAHLESTHLVFQIPNYGGGEERTQRRGKKIFFADCGLRHAVLQRGSKAMSPDAQERGRFYENAVAAHLQTLAVRTGRRLYHWREGKDEVDFVLDTATGPIAVEVASGPNHTRRGLAALLRKRPEFRGRQWLTWPGAPHRAPNGDAPGSINLADLLLVAGWLADRAL
ncbi:MAG: ATP-binding protein [Deltaproteobacteria bacterium]|nr:ATP-binding protein [Deltaproteobacteria bacterium]